MPKSEQQPHDLEIREVFSGSRLVDKSALRKYYRQHVQDGTEQAFRRYLYGLEKRQVVFRVGSGGYVFHDPSPRQVTKKRRFLPNWSQELMDLNKTVQEAFPYLQVLAWETRVLHDFMVLQPGPNLFIVEAEKEGCESVFHNLSQQNPGKVFLNPDRLTMERYALRQTEPILVSRLITQLPWQTIHGLAYPKLEKILVDIFADKEKFYFFQGKELVRIFENAFAAYWVSEKTLFRYAGRRKASGKLRHFISAQTRIELSSNLENAK
ncbi:MAG: hypothetical protein COS37_02730 [Anaerolineae bacterium CG03_land_8_20_14_0_80_58_20]|nr:MAG: hypothetical protein COS37_02730 [Anaerolineae bacterium CG03_land_8_20_14_0_80_58_20]